MTERGDGTDATGSDYLLDALVRQGVSRLFGIIGEGNAHLIDRTNDADIEFTQARHEQAAVTMADGYARIAGRPAVCTLTHGPGVTNGATGIASADRDGVPLVVLVGDAGSVDRETSLQYLEHRSFTQPISVYQTRVERIEGLAGTLRRAFDAAATEGGPAVVEVPTDVQEAAAPRGEYAPVERPPHRIGPDADRLSEAVALLEGSERPAVLAGGGAAKSGAGAALEAFARHVGAPIATTFYGKGVLPDSHPLVSGIAGTFMTPANDELLWNVDVLVAAGARLSGKSTRYGELLDGVDVVQIDVDRSAIGTYHDPAVELVGDARRTLEALTERVTARPDRAEDVAATIEEAGPPEAIAFESDDDRIDPRELTVALAERIPEGIVCVDSGNNTGFPAVFHRVEDGRMLVNGNFGTMGYAVPAAIGAKLAAPDRPVVCYTGDGAFMQVVQEVETAARLGLPVVFAVLNDGSYGIIRHRQRRTYGRETASSYDSPAFVDVAEGFGALAAEVRSVEDLTVVDDFLAEEPDAPLVLDARTISEVSRPGFPPY